MNAPSSTDRVDGPQLGIFAALAPDYYERGLSLVPIKAGTKAPAIEKWTGFCDNLPKAESQRELIANFGRCGVGVCLGREVVPGLRFAAIDIDTDALQGPIRGLFGQPKCSKRGRKGETLFVLADKSIKSTSLKDAGGKQVVDILIGGRQTVLPPTLHPDTGRPYEWLGPSLLEIKLEDLPVLDPRKFEILKTVVASQHLAALIAGDSNDHA